MIGEISDASLKAISAMRANGLIGYQGVLSRQDAVVQVEQINRGWWNVKKLLGVETRSRLPPLVNEAHKF